MSEICFYATVIIIFLLAPFLILYLVNLPYSGIIEKQYRQCLDKAKKNAGSGFKTLFILHENNHIGYKTEKITKKLDNHNNKT